MTLTQMRHEVTRAVRLLRDHGDQHLHLLDGLDVLGPGDAGHLFDGLHPDAAGYRLMAQRITPEIDRLLNSTNKTPA